MTPLKQMRLAKAIAQAGVCSRRDAEKLITDGKVTVNGKMVLTPVTLITQEDLICVEGHQINQKPPPRVWAYYKPRGVITTHKDPQGRTTLFDLLPRTLPRVISVGRLDYMSEGLILLTNDGELARGLELPSNQIPRTYRVKIFGHLSEQQIRALKQGITVENMRYGPIHTIITQQSVSNQWLEVTLREGKNREIRKVMSFLNVKVSRLIRIKYGPIALEDLKPKEIKEIPPALLLNRLKDRV